MLKGENHPGADHELQAQDYAERNPVKVGLVVAARDWPWSSARFRNEYGRLVLQSRDRPSATERGRSRAPFSVACERSNLLLNFLGAGLGFREEEALIHAGPFVAGRCQPCVFRNILPLLH